ncbi:MAG: hypothetical protein J3R72DRAFT_490368 [Linnemannia gamsii]|nr:MAG: hypothetical protein J3R72DRAFT_490368 [Linnemannia gamsii]
MSTLLATALSTMTILSILSVALARGGSPSARSILLTLLGHRFSTWNWSFRSGLKVWSVFVSGKVDAIVIAETCPRRRKIDLNGTWQVEQDFNDDSKWPLRVMVGLPQNTVETLRLYMDEHRLGEPLMQPKNTTLEICRALEEMSISTSINLRDNATSESPWASPSLCHICSASSSLCPLILAPLYCKPYHPRTPSISPASPPVVRVASPVSMEDFYRQIRRQINMRHKLKKPRNLSCNLRADFCFYLNNLKVKYATFEFKWDKYL